MKTLFDSDYLSIGQVQVGLLRSSDVKFALTLHYLNGNCSWRVTTHIAGFVREEELSIGPQIKIRGEGQLVLFNLKCVVDESVKLHAVITLYGELTLTFEFPVIAMNNDVLHCIDTIPAPGNVMLDTNKKILQWNHVFQPSDLPPDFELVHVYNITYLVHVSDKDTRTSVNVLGSRSLNLDDEPVLLNGCAEQEFVVQAVINNELYSENSSVVSGNFSVGKCSQFSDVYICV